MKKKINVSIVGGSGYTGIELLRLLSQHPHINIQQITSRGDKGRSVSAVYPSLRGFITQEFVNPDEADLTNSDIVFFATPNGIAMQYAQDLIKKGVRIIDLAADFRIKNTEVWEKWYGMKHICKDLLKDAVYGLPEMNRDRIKKAQIVANPGCYPTAIQLGLLPLIKNNLIDKSNIIADAKSGISGAGKKFDTNLLMSESAENFKAYAIQGHRHLPEIEENLSIATQDSKIKLTFVPHLLPMIRGIHATIYVDAIADFDISALYQKFYANEPFVDILSQGECPEIKSVRSSNICRISFQKQTNSNKIVILSVIDNLVKGAAGQAIQNMNIMMSCDETAGLKLIPLVP